MQVIQHENHVGCNGVNITKYLADALIANARSYICNRDKQFVFSILKRSEAIFLVEVFCTIFSINDNNRKCDGFARHQ